MAGEIEATRARFWRRAIAFFIDVFTIGIFLSVLGLALFKPTNGAIRISSVPLSARHCSEVSSPPVGIRLPPDFRVTHIFRCTFQFLGFVYNRVGLISEVTPLRGGIFTTRTVRFAIDAHGQPVRAFYLDYLGIFLLPACLLLSEWRFGKTLGKYLLDVRVRSLSGGALTIGQAAKRLLVRSIPSLVLAPVVLLPYLMDPAATITVKPAPYVASGTAGLALLVNFIISVRRSALPWHDRWAKTEVVRGR